MLANKPGAQNKHSALNYAKSKTDNVPLLVLFRKELIVKI